MSEGQTKQPVAGPLHDLARTICHAVEQRIDDCDMEMHARVCAAIRRWAAADDSRKALDAVRTAFDSSAWVGDWDEARNREYARKLRAGEPTTKEEWDASYKWHQDQLRRQSEKSPTVRISDGEHQP